MNLETDDASRARARLHAVLDAAGFAPAERIELLLGPPSVPDDAFAGLADTDAIVSLGHLTERRLRPPELPDALAERLRAARFEAAGADRAEIAIGDLAVTIFRDGASLRLVPALRDGDDLRMADPSGTNWFGISPAFFASVLTTEDARLEGRLVPLIKRAKQALLAAPDRPRLAGYHVETLAIAVFRGYAGPLTLEPMLEHYFEAAADAVLRPLVNASGTSLHIDDDLGPAGSATREATAASLRAIAASLAKAPSGSREGGS